MVCLLSKTNYLRRMNCSNIFICLLGSFLPHCFQLWSCETLPLIMFVKFSFATVRRFGIVLISNLMKRKTSDFVFTSLWYWEMKTYFICKSRMPISCGKWMNQDWKEFDVIYFYKIPGVDRRSSKKLIKLLTNWFPRITFLTVKVTLFERLEEFPIKIRINIGWVAIKLWLLITFKRGGFRIIAKTC